MNPVDHIPPRNTDLRPMLTVSPSLKQHILPLQASQPSPPSPPPHDTAMMCMMAVRNCAGQVRAAEKSQRFEMLFIVLSADLMKEGKELFNAM